MSPHLGRGRRTALAVLALGFLVGCAAPTDRPRVLVIGLDGATFAVLDPLLEEGVLPNLASLSRRGREAYLQSTVPAVSPPAWTSAITGVNPGKHNIFDFFHFSRGGPQPLLTSSLDRRARPVWHFLNEAGFRTGIVNIPMTFPPDRVDGFFISGFPYGRARTGFTYPPELEAELGDYPLDLFGESVPPGTEEQLLRRFRHTLERQSEEVRRLMREERWDLFWVVFTGTDKVQHFYWKFADPDHPRHDPGLAERYGSVIRDFWIRVDQIVGEMLDIAGPDTDVMVLSDHGFGPIYEELRLWGWLKHEGFFEPVPGRPDASRAEAIAPGAFGGLLRVNQVGRDFGGIVPPEEAARVRERLRERLDALKAPGSGGPFVERVYTREEIYSGPYVENAPDLLFEEAPGRFIGRGKPGTDDVFGLPSYTFSAYHRPDGILIVAGPDFPPGTGRGEFSILDIAPILYWLFDVEAPNDLDGRVPKPLVGAEALRDRPPRIGEASAVILPRDAEPEGDREVLESLGYVQ